MRNLAVILALLSLTACSKDSPSAPSQPDYSGNWTSLQPHSSVQVGTGVLFTISGMTITSATVVTENYFGFAPQPGCVLSFTATGPATIAGNTFVVPLSLASNPISGISTLPLATDATFTSASTGWDLQLANDGVRSTELLHQLRDMHWCDLHGRRAYARIRQPDPRIHRNPTIAIHANEHPPGDRPRRLAPAWRGCEKGQGSQAKPRRSVASI